MERTTVFLSYSQQDAKSLERLQVHLKPLERQGLIESWDDSRIKPGSAWRDEIRKALRSAKVAVLLVSPDFLASEFIHQNELLPLLKAAKEDGAIILPVILSPCLYTEIPELQEFQAVNDPQRPLVKMTRGSREQVFLNVAQAVKQSLQQGHTGMTMMRTEEDKSPDWESMSSDDVVSLLSNPDPLVCVAAAQRLRNIPGLGRQLLEVSGTRVVMEAVRAVLSTYPQESAQVLVEALRDCGVTGETWHRARRAAEHFTPAHRPYAEGPVGELLTAGLIEVNRHALTAMGGMGELMHWEDTVRELLDSSYGFQKCFRYAFDAGVRSFLIAADEREMRSASRQLFDLIERGASGKEVMWSIEFTTECQIRHVDTLQTLWLASDMLPVQRLGVAALGDLRASRAVPRLLKILERSQDEELSRGVAAALWRIATTEAITPLLGLDLNGYAGASVAEGVEYVQDEELVRRLLPTVLSTEPWLMYRAIGLNEWSSMRNQLRTGLLSTEPIDRGSAALALARLGSKDQLKRAHSEASTPLERVLCTLSLLITDLIRYEDVEKCLREDLAQGRSYDYRHQLQSDILASLRRCRAPSARLLADAWTPYYRVRAITGG